MGSDSANAQNGGWTLQLGHRIRARRKELGLSLLPDSDLTYQLLTPDLALYLGDHPAHLLRPFQKDRCLHCFEVNKDVENL